MLSSTSYEKNLFHFSTVFSKGFENRVNAHLHSTLILSTAHARTVVGKQAKVAILTICPSELRALQGKKWLRKTTQKVASIGL